MQRMNEDGSTTPQTTFGGSGWSSSRVIIVLVVLFLLVAIAALIIAAVAVSKTSGSSQDGSQAGQNDPNNYDNDQITCYGSPREPKKNGNGKRIYNIAVGHDYGAYEYIDKRGYLAGFTLDLIDEVCREAMIDCRIIWEPYNNCVTSKAGEHPRGGVGLMDSWYDACATWVVTVPRIQIFKFSMSYLKVSQGVFYIKTDDTSFDFNNFVNKKIGFLDGWAYDEKCLARNTDKVLPKEKIQHFVNPKDLYDAIVKGTVDAGFAGVIDLKGWADMASAKIKMVGPRYQCVIRGNGMISRKDNNFPEKFDIGLSKLMASGRFSKLCKEAQAKHTKDDRGAVECV